MRSRRLTIRRVMQSPLVKKKSPTSAWRPSTCSTRKTRQRLRAAYRSLTAVAVAVAVAAVAVAAAVVAEPAAAAAVAAAVAAVCPGVLAVYAKHDPTYLINASGHGRVRQDRPGQSMSRLRRGPHTRVAETANIGRTALQLFRNASARTAWCKNSGGRRTSPLGRSGVVSKMHVLTL